MPDLTEAVQLSDPLAVLEPVPNFGCKVCAALGRQREDARDRGDMTTVTDSNVEIRRHPHEVKR
ncbi:hypothetical protein OH733_19585 [Streptomyces griseus]|nr:hypothetical protein OH733_19585 [Streptomyces griseus]WTD68568.1 hypothetical protein OH763_17405 [Streptomyces griseus]